jgi:hypothetical protein
MRVPLTTALETRDGSSAKDQRLFNGIAEVAGDQVGVIKRPGNTYLGAVSSGASQMLAELSGSAVAVTNDSVKTVTPFPFVLESTSSLSPITAGLDLTSAVKGQGDNVKSLLIKSSQEAWVLT